MKKSSFTSLYVTLTCLLGRSVLGDVLFNTFGPNDSFDGSAAFNVTWNLYVPPPAGALGIASAARFQISSGSYTLSSVSLAMGYTQGTNNLAIRIVADSGGQPTGPLLETIVSHPTGITGQSQVVTYPSSLDPVMIGGSSYWLVLEPADLNLVDASSNGAYNWFTGWNVPLGATGYHEFNFSSQDWYAWQVSPNNWLPAFRIEGFAVPEPSSFSLLLFGVALFGLQWGKRRER
jgi:hypothetical protein